MELGRGTKTRQVRVAFGLISYLVLNYYLVPRVHVCARVFVVPKQYIYIECLLYKNKTLYILRGETEKKTVHDQYHRQVKVWTCVLECLLYKNNICIECLSYKTIHYLIYITRENGEKTVHDQYHRKIILAKPASKNSRIDPEI